MGNSKINISEILQIFFMGLSAVAFTFLGYTQLALLSTDSSILIRGLVYIIIFVALFITSVVSSQSVYHAVHEC